MKEAKVVCISDIERSRRGTSLGEDLSVFHGAGIADVFGHATKSSFYFRAYSYLLVLHGRALMTIDQVPYPLTSHTLVSQSPMHLVQFVEVSGDFEFKVMSLTRKMMDSLKLVNISPRIVEGVRTHLRPVSILTPDEARVVDTGFDAIGDSVAQVGHRYRRELVENSICRFFLEYDNIFLNRADEGAEAPINARRQSIVEDFIGLVSENLLEHRDVGYYCRQMGITPQYLNRVMTSQTGMRPSSFISEMLYAEARNMLASGRVSVQDVAMRLGFSDQSAFGKFFKRCSGLSPCQFAKQS